MKMDGMRKIEVRGDKISVYGDTYPVRNTLKSYRLRWDSFAKEWNGSVGKIGVKMLWKLGYEIGAEIFVSSYSLIDEVKGICERFGSYDDGRRGWIFSPEETMKVWKSLRGGN